MTSVIGRTMVGNVCYVLFIMMTSVWRGESVSLPADNMLLSLACPSDADCGGHLLSCEPDSVLKVRGSIHGYKPVQQQPYCRSESRDLCQAKLDECCQYYNSSDCLQLAPEDDLHLIYKLCQGRGHCLYRSQHVVSGSCETIDGYTPFSAVSYTCVNRSLLLNPSDKISLVGPSVHLFYPGRVSTHPFVNDRLKNASRRRVTDRHMRDLFNTERVNEAELTENSTSLSPVEKEEGVKFVRRTFHGSGRIRWNEHEILTDLTGALRTSDQRGPDNNARYKNSYGHAASDAGSMKLGVSGLLVLGQPEKEKLFSLTSLLRRRRNVDTQNTVFQVHSRYTHPNQTPLCENGNSTDSSISIQTTDTMQIIGNDPTTGIAIDNGRSNVTTVADDYYLNVTHGHTGVRTSRTDELTTQTIDKNNSNYPSITTTDQAVLSQKDDKDRTGNRAYGDRRENRKHEGILSFLHQPFSPSSQPSTQMSGSTGAVWDIDKLGNILDEHELLEEPSKSENFAGETQSDLGISFKPRHSDSDDAGIEHHHCWVKSASSGDDNELIPLSINVIYLRMIGTSGCTKLTLTDSKQQEVKFSCSPNHVTAERGRSLGVLSAPLDIRLELSSSAWEDDFVWLEFKSSDGSALSLSCDSKGEGETSDSDVDWTVLTAVLSVVGVSLFVLLFIALWYFLRRKRRACVASGSYDVSQEEKGVKYAMPLSVIATTASANVQQPVLPSRTGSEPQPVYRKLPPSPGSFRLSTLPPLPEVTAVTTSPLAMQPIQSILQYPEARSTPDLLDVIPDTVTLRSDHERGRSKSHRPTAAQRTKPKADQPTNNAVSSSRIKPTPARRTSLINSALFNRPIPEPVTCTETRIPVTDHEAKSVERPACTNEDDGDSVYSAIFNFDSTYSAGWSDFDSDSVKDGGNYERISWNPNKRKSVLRQT